MNPYETLGVSPESGNGEIRAAYLALIKKWHPDKFFGTPEYDKASDITAQINTAYEMLKDRSESGSLSGWEARFRQHQRNHQAYERREREKRESGYAYARDYSTENEGGAEPGNESAYNSDGRFLDMAYEMAISGNARTALRYLALIREKGAKWHYVKGCAHHALKDYTNAIEEFEAALRAEPGDSEYRAAWGKSVAARRHGRKVKAAVAAAAAAAVTAAAIAIFK